MIPFHSAKISTERTPEQSAVVRYNGWYAGCVKRHEGGTYRCAVRLDANVLHECGSADNLRDAARAVAYYWWLHHCRRPAGEQDVAARPASSEPPATV